MFFYEGLSCPVCGKVFEEHEDIVSCPVCGAPHHRDCWMAEGHCHFESKHGTEEQWSKESAKAETNSDDSRRCPHCGAANSPFVEFCGHCGRPIEGQTWQSSEPAPAEPTFREYAPYRIRTTNQFGGVPKDDVISGVSAEDLAAVVDQNTTYYLPRFSKMEREGRALSFNWAAFLLTPYWLMFRKNYLFGTLTLLFSLINTAISSYVQIVKLGWLGLGSAADMYNQLNEILNSGSPLAKYLYLMAGMSLVSFLISLAFGLFGNYLYLQTCVGRINKMQEQFPTTYKSQLRSVGGVSLGLVLLTMLITYFAPTLIEILITL